MAAHYTLHIGSAGGGVTSTPDRGETWNVSGGSVPPECTVRALSSYPGDSHRILAGSDAGLFRSENNGLTYQLLDTSRSLREYPKYVEVCQLDARSSVGVDLLASLV